MRVYSDSQLNEYVERALEGIEKERFIIEDLDKYLTSPNDRKVCCMYGLRRTGKTIMSLQEIRKMGAENCAYIICEENDYTSSLRKAMEENGGKKYIFIDEATAMYDFIAASAFLADQYAMVGTKIVISGTDSLGFLLAHNDALYGRAHLLHTTYIPFAEYNHVLNENLLSYIKYGGTLTPENTFYNYDSLNEYSNSAITFNILHSLQNWQAGKNVGLSLLSNIADRELPTFINKVIEIHNRTFLSKVLNDDFKSHDLGSLVQLLGKNGNIDPAPIHTKDMEERIRVFLDIRQELPVNADEQAVSTIISYLEKLDVLYHIPNTEEYIFTQCGMRYCQANALAEALVTSEEFSGYTAAEKKDILEKIESDICGGILEDIVFYQFVKELENNDKCTVTKYRNLSGKEFDIVISDFAEKTSAVIEVKLSTVQHENQMRHLLDEEFCKEVEKTVTGLPITEKAVIYMGETDLRKGIRYINAEEYLTNAKEYTDCLISKDCGKTSLQWGKKNGSEFPADMDN